MQGALAQSGAHPQEGGFAGFFEEDLKRGASHAQHRMVPLGICSILLVFAIAFGGMLPCERAYADGGVSFVEVHFATQPGETLSDGAVEWATDCSPAPSQAWYASLQFDKNVSYARDDIDEGFIQRNLERMHVLDASGQEVSGVRFYGGGTQAERQLIYLAVDEWLAPLSEYTIVAEEGIEAANGIDVTDQEIKIGFKTSAELSIGATVFDVAFAIVVVVLLIAGMSVQSVRRARQRR